MDVRSWKKILLQWITECGFMERNYFNIEQSDIDAFFQNYCKHHRALHEIGHRRSSTSAATAGHKISLTEFLQDNYPDFEPNLNDENEFSAADYIYVYSLLLHFCCVKYPEAFFHDICQKLTEQSQQCIASFFKQLLVCSSVNREFLRHAIADVAATHLSPTSQNDSFSSSSNHPSPPNQSRLLESPLKTPKRQAPSQRISPSTPKSFLLEERTRELYNLRAQLETERYEKGLLEVQIKQNEDKILKLNKDHKKLQQQIQDLKNDILTKNTETSSPNRDGDEQIKRRLCREISQKEQEISKLTDILSVFREEKSFVQEKLTYAEKQIVACMDRIKELDYKVDELTVELEHKNGTIKYLTDNKLELEQFISDTRSASASSRPDLNMSIDCLDASFSRTQNSSGSISSPENLGVSVVDKQLREKENENYQLHEDLTVLRSNNTRLAKHLQQMTFKHSQEFNISVESIQLNEEEDVDPAEHLIIFANCVDKICKYYKDERQTVQVLKEQAYTIQATNSDLKQRLEQFENEVCVLKESMNSIEFKNVELEHDKQELQDKLEYCEMEIDTLNKQKFDLVTKLEALANDYAAHKESCDAQQKNYAALIEKHAELSENNELRKTESEALQSDLQALQNKQATVMLEHDRQLKSLNDKLANQQLDLDLHKSTEQLFKEKHEKLLVQCEHMKQISRETDSHLEVMRNEITLKEQEMNKLGVEIVEVRSKNIELEERIDKLLTEFATEKQNSDIVLNNREQRIKEIESECITLQQQLVKTQEDLETTQADYTKSRAELEATFVAVESIYELLKVPMLASCLSADVENMRGKIKEFVEQRIDAGSKIECLEFDKLANSTQIQMLEGQLKEEQELVRKHEHQLKEMQHELQLKIKEYDTTKVQQEYTIENLHKEQQEKNESFGKLAMTCIAHENALRLCEDELKVEKEQYLCKERELKLVIAEHNDVKKKLNETQQANNKLQTEFDEKIKCFESKIDLFTGDNMQLIKEIQNFKHEHGANAERLQEADEVINQLTAQLDEEQNSRSETNSKLKSSEVRWQKTELKLENLLEEKSQTIIQLKKSLETQTAKLKSLQEQTADVERLKEEQMSGIEVLKKQLQALTEEKERLFHDALLFSAQIKKEQCEKSVLLRSLEHTADQLKEAVDEKGKFAAQLEKRCTDLQTQLSAANVLNTKLQGELVAQKAELQIAHDEQQQEAEDFQYKLSELMRKLAAQSGELETNELILMEISTALENNTNLAREKDLGDISDVFNAKAHDNNKAWTHLKNSLNRLLFNVSKAEEKAAHTTALLNKNNAKLNYQLTRQQTEIVQLQELLASEAQTIENKLNNEVHRLEDDLQNLERVNEKLSDENTKLQYKLSSLEDDIKHAKFNMNMLSEEKDKLHEEQKFNAQILLQHKQHEQSLQENIIEKQERIKELSEQCAQLEQQLIERKTVDNKDLQVANNLCTKVQQELSEIQRELKEQTDQLLVQQTNNETLESELAMKSKELGCLQTKITEECNMRQQLEEELQTTIKKLDESITIKLTCESKCEQLSSQLQHLQRDFELSKSQHYSAVADMERFVSELNTTKSEKLQLNSELKECKRDLQRANENVSKLIQQIASIRLEKESVVEEHQLLRKQLEENGKHQSTSESKLKTIVERSQLLERNLLTAENELKSLRTNAEKIESNADKLTTENKRLRDSQEAATKRIEKMALKLGESQARSSKLERDNDKLTKIVDANNNTVEALLREKDTLQSDAKTLKERVSNAERMQDQLVAKLQTLEQTNVALRETKNKQEALAIDAKSKITKLEKMRDTNEEKIRKLNNALSTSEHTNVRLNLEIGALNSQLVEVKQVVSADCIDQVETLSRNLNETKIQAQQYVELGEKLSTEAQQLRDKNSNIGDQLSKVSLALQISKERCETLTQEMQQLSADMLAIRTEKSEVEQAHVNTCAKLNEFEMLNEPLLADRNDNVTALEGKVSQLEAELASKVAEVSMLHKEVESLQQNVSTQKLSSSSNTIFESSNEEIEQLRNSLALAESVLDTEQKLSSQLRLDNQILQAKYREAKQRMLEESKASEERIKENRLELEGKLEKMKNKMKTLYTEEISKMKAKQERETVNLKSEMDVLMAQNNKYEEHTRKLSGQIVRLNENILEYQKQIAILSTKLKHSEENEVKQFKRPNSIHVSTISSTTTAAPAQTNIGTNLAMEDEEGEVFNNTYLTDMKNGRMSEFTRKDVCVEELQYRNSLCPPHLKSTYAAQYDHGLGEDELKDGPNSLDDSMSALLSTTVGGTRKKINGATHYKRPGPPTPSKNGGRLSFGGSSEPTREILKESCDGNATTVSSSKTPARFGFFASRFSMGNATKDELNFSNMLKTLQKKNLHYIRLENIAAGCTSTPRKSKSHFDQRRLLDQMITSSPSPSPLSADTQLKPTLKHISPPNVSFIETPLTTQQRRKPTQTASHLKFMEQEFARRRRRSSLLKRRISRRLQGLIMVTPSTDQETTSSAQSNSPLEIPRNLRQRTFSSGGVRIAVLQRRLQRRPKRERGARPSLNLHGNIFAKCRTPNRAIIRDLNRNKARKQRIDNFNKFRMLKVSSTSVTLVKGEDASDATFDVQNNNYASFNHNNLGKTLTVVKDEELEREQQEAQNDEYYVDENEDYGIGDSYPSKDIFLEDEDVEVNDDEHDYDENDYDDDDYDDDDYNEDDNVETDESFTKELVSAQDLYDFDKKFEICYNSPEDQLCFIKKEQDTSDIDHLDQGDVKYFEKLLTVTESNAPFEVKSIRYNSTSTDIAAPLTSFNSDDNPSISSSHLTLPACSSSSVLSAATPHNSPINLSAHNSRTIYGNSVIYNRRIPHLNTTYVRKSSIYIKKKKNHARRNSTLFHDATDDIIWKIMWMWKQMDNSTRLIVCFALLASITTLASLFVVFRKR